MKEIACEEAAFMGKITAGATHELKNVLAIVRESAGLLEDLLSLPTSQDFPHRERFMRALKSMKDQVVRGNALLIHLNRFAHCPDQEVASVQVQELLNSLCLLSERFIRGRSIHLEVLGGGRDEVIRTKPLRLQMFLFSLILSIADALPQGSLLKVETLGDEGRVTIRFQWFPENLQRDQVERIAAYFSEEEGKRLAEDLSASVKVDAAHINVAFAKA